MLTPETRDEILTEIATLVQFMDKLRNDPDNKREFDEIEEQYYELLDKLRDAKENF